VHLVGFIIRIYHDARSPESQIQSLTSIPYINHLININTIFTEVGPVAQSV